MKSVLSSQSNFSEVIFLLPLYDFPRYISAKITPTEKTQLLFYTRRTLSYSAVLQFTIVKYCFCTASDPLGLSQTKEWTSCSHELLKSFWKRVNLIMRGYSVRFSPFKHLSYKSGLLFMFLLHLTKGPWCWCFSPILPQVSLGHDTKSRGLLIPK